MVPGQDYTVVEEGMDWVLIRHRGDLIYVFKNLVAQNENFDR